MVRAPTNDALKLSVSPVTPLAGRDKIDWRGLREARQGRARPARSLPQR